MGTPGKRSRWFVSVVFLVTASAYAQVFTYKDQAEHFEAVVTQERIVVKERYKGASTIYGDLSCPLGLAVQATALPLAGDGKLCLTFSKERCGYTRFQNGNAIHKEELANAAKPRMCIALGNAQEAERLATLVNTGPHRSHQPAIAPVAQAATANAEVVTPAASQPMRQAVASPVSMAQKSAALPAKPEARITKERAEKAAAKRIASAKASAGVPASERDQPHARNGKWITSWFTVRLGGNPQMAERTYASASIVDDSGAARKPGGHLYIRNESDKYPLYYGFSAAKDKLGPGEEVTLSLASSPSASTVGITQKSLTLRWFDETAVERTGGR